jgi:pyruvate dehydrogenase E1 component alpha subunit
MIRAGQITVVYYSPWGEEVLAASVGAALRPDDQVVTTYRGVHDQLAKGVSLASIWAEFLGKGTGTCKGKGGPMHITDTANGLMVTTGVVGSGLPIANGLALAARTRGSDAVAVVNFGDGATNIGAFHEALNMAAVWKLPVVFVCQNNGYAEHTSLAGGTSVAEIATRAKSYTIPGVRVDGNDAAATYEAMTAAVARARAGEGPTLLEAVTYRFGGHAMNDKMEYMPKEEYAAALAADPVPRLRQQILDDGIATEGELEAIDAAIKVELDAAVEAALSASGPDVSELLTDVFSTSGAR